jgi:Leucine-rich repeat (LRR) protein
MKQLLLICAVVALVGCGGGKQEETKQGKDTLVQTADTKTCYWCKESIKAAALVCKYCSKNPHSPSEQAIEAAIRKSINKPEGELTKADLEKVRGLNLSNNLLTEVPKELEKLDQLKVLNLMRNKLTDVKGLEKLTQLTVLDLYNNQLTEVPKELEKLDQLKVLNLGRNQLTNVKGLEKLTHLTTLWLSSNQLTDVKGLEKLTRLTMLQLQGNKLTGVKGLEKLTQLTYLSLGDNKLTDVKGLEKLTGLEDLFLGGNPDLTKSQIAELQKALAKCRIYSNPTK